MSNSESSPAKRSRLGDGVADGKDSLATASSHGALGEAAPGVAMEHEATERRPATSGDGMQLAEAAEQGAAAAAAVLPFVRLSKAAKRELKAARIKAHRAETQRSARRAKSRAAALRHSDMSEAEKLAAKEARGETKRAMDAHLDVCLAGSEAGVLTIAIDLGFSGPADVAGTGAGAGGGDGGGGEVTNTARENSSLAKQLNYLYASLRKRELTCSLHLCGYGTSGAREALDKAGAASWRVHRHFLGLGERQGPGTDAGSSTASAAAAAAAAVAAASTAAGAAAAADQAGAVGTNAGAAAEAGAEAAAAAAGGGLWSERPLDPRRAVVYLSPDGDEEISGPIDVDTVSSATTQIATACN